MTPERRTTISFGPHPIYLKPDDLVSLPAGEWRDSDSMLGDFDIEVTVALVGEGVCLTDGAWIAVEFVPDGELRDIADYRPFVYVRPGVRPVEQDGGA